jgi:hypothetical protein
MEFSNHYCINKACSDYGKQGLGNIKLRAHVGKNKDIHLLICKTCGKTFSENRNTMFFRLRTPKEKVIQALQCLVEGNSIRATSRITKLNKDTVGSLLEKASQHIGEVSNHILKDIESKEIQLDELWGFIKKKRRIFRK